MIYVVEASKQATVVPISVSIQKLMIVFTFAATLFNNMDKKREKDDEYASGNVPTMAWVKKNDFHENYLELPPSS